jgi:hypothetical protein
MPNNKDYIVVQGWMINDLNLNGNELMAYALIYGFTKDGQSEYTGSINYLANWLNCTRKTAIKILHDLVDKKLIKKTQIEVNNVIFNKYAIITPLVQKLHQGSVENTLGGSVNITLGGSVEITPNNTILNNTNIDNTKDNINTCFSFESFWNMYPIKNQKQDVIKKYQKLTESQRAEIRATLPKFLEFKPFANYKHPNPLTYINQKRWEDVIVTLKEEKSIKWD